MERAERRSWSRVEPWAAALALAGCALRLGRGLGPAPFYNSDCAAPILVMQGMEKGAFTLFYPRQDRFGMWPFLLGRALHLQTPEAYHSLSVLGLCSAAIPLSGVLGNPALAVLTLMVPFVMYAVRSGVALPPGGPAVPLAGRGDVLGVVGLQGGAHRPHRQEPLARARRLRGGLVAGDLDEHRDLAALLSVGVLEAFRARARPGRVAGMLAGLGAAGAFDAGLRRRYAVECLERFGRTFVTPLRIDRGHVLANLGPVLASLRHEGGLWPFLVGAAAIAAPRRTRAERLDGLALLLFGLSVLPGLVLVRYFRDNQFAGRYLSLPTFWALAAAVHGLLLVACSAGRTTPAGRARARPLRAGRHGATVPSRNPLAEARADAARLAAAGPAVLLADYLDVYVPASLAPPGVLVPVGAEGNLDRFPGDRGRAPPGHDGLRPARSTGRMGRWSSTARSCVAWRLRRFPGAPVRGAGMRWSGPRRRCRLASRG